MTELDSEIPSTSYVSEWMDVELSKEITLVLRDPAEVLAEYMRDDITLKKVEESIQSNRKSIENIEIDEDDADILIEADEKKAKRTILDNPPGLDFLEPSDCGCLYDAGSLPISNFVTNNSRSIGKYILQLSNEALYKDIMAKKFQSMICSSDITHSLCHYVFHLMSVHENNTLVEACLSHLAMYRDQFVPTVNDVLTVFVNWGFRLDVYIPNFEYKVPEAIQSIGVRDSKVAVSYYNFEKVLDYLCWMFSTAPLLNSEVKCLLQVLLLMTQDKDFCISSAVGKCLDCVHTLMYRVRGESWPEEEIVSLVKMLHFKDIHFHNQCVMSSNILGPTNISRNMCQALAYASMQQLLNITDIRYVSSLNMSNLWELIWDNKDIHYPSHYEQYIALKLLQQCVWLIPFKTRDKEYMDHLHKWLCDIKLPSDEASFDLNLIKEHISFMKSSWAIMKKDFLSHDIMQGD